MPNIGTESNISLIRFAEQSVTPTTPDSAFSAIYMKADGLYVIDDAGAVTGPLSSIDGALLADGSVALAGAWNMGNYSLTNVNVDSGTITGITDLLIADGGTGRSSSTAYSVICGGTTSTQPQQSVSGVGTANQVLTSNGPLTLPTWEDTSGGGSLRAHNPQGRLSLTSGDPNDESDVTGSTLYYTPYLGDEISLVDPSTFVYGHLYFTEKSLSLSGYTANTLYDIWGYDNSGTLALDSTSWGTNTAYNISAMTAADPCVITYLHTSQIFAVGDDVCIQGITGNINTVTHAVTSITAIATLVAGVSYQIQIQIDTTGLTYTSGGTVRLLKNTRTTSIVLYNDIPRKSGDVLRRYLGTILIGGDGGEATSSTARRHVANYYNRVPLKIRSSLDAASSFTFAAATVFQLSNTPNCCNDGQGRVSYVTPYDGCALQGIWGTGMYTSVAGKSGIMSLEQNTIADYTRVAASDNAFAAQASYFSAGFASLFGNNDNEGYNYIQQLVYGTATANITVWVGDTNSSGKFQYGLRGHILT